MGKTGRISVKTVIANVIRNLQLRNVNDLIDYMIEWAYEAEVMIGSYDTFERKECEVDIKDFRIKLPHDFYQFISLKIGDKYPEVTNRDFRLFYKNGGNLASNTPDEILKMTLESGWIHISGIDTETTAGLSYMALSLDEEGYPYIKDGHQMAVAAYIVYMMKLKDFTEGKISQGAYDKLEKRWYWLCGQARGDDEMPDARQMDYIASLYNQLLPSPSKNNF